MNRRLADSRRGGSVKTPDRCHQADDIPGHLASDRRSRRWRSGRSGVSAVGAVELKGRRPAATA